MLNKIIKVLDDKITDKTAGYICLAVIVLGLILMLWPGNVYGATYPKEIKFDYPSDQYDTVILVVKPLAGANPGTRDSVMYTSFPVIDTLTLDKDTSYDIRAAYSWSGDDGIHGWSSQIIVSASATVSTADKQEIAGYVDDTLTEKHGAGAWTTGGTGAGSNTVTIYATDTSGTDTRINFVEITVKTMAGVTDAVMTTGSSGYATFTLQADTFIFIGKRPDYVWITDTIVITTNQTDSIVGYDVPLPTPSDPSFATVVLDVSRLRGIEDIMGVCLTAYNEVGANKYTMDTTGGAKLLLPIAESACADSSGRISLTLVKSNEIVDTTQGFYVFQGKYNEEVLFTMRHMYVTASFNLGDSLALR